MKRFQYITILLAVAASSIFVSCGSKKQVVTDNGTPVNKREFRGAWIQCVNGQFQGMGTEAMQKNLTHQLNVLQAEGANAIIFRFVLNVTPSTRATSSLGASSSQADKARLLHLIGTRSSG